MWKRLDAQTEAMLVPGGFIIKYGGLEESGNGITMTDTMVYVPCDFDTANTWIKENLLVQPEKTKDK